MSWHVDGFHCAVAGDYHIVVSAFVVVAGHKGVRLNHYPEHFPFIEPSVVYHFRFKNHAVCGHLPVFGDEFDFLGEGKLGIRVAAFD